MYFFVFFARFGPLFIVSSFVNVFVLFCLVFIMRERTLGQDAGTGFYMFFPRFLAVVPAFPVYQSVLKR